MSLINVSNLTFAYEGSYDNIFNNVSFQIDTDWKLGLTGRNGRGKTTFLKLLAGEYPFGGTISANVHFDYFPFTVADPEELTLAVLEAVAPDAQGWQIQKELNKLAVDEGALYRPFCTLSNGEQTKALLAGLFLRDNRFLLIDEPTNHLDMEARQTVARYLNGKSSFILVSHDRIFMDACVDHMLSINKTNIEVTNGNFSVWAEQKARRDAFELSENERLGQEIARLKEVAAQTAEWSDRVEKTRYGTYVAGLKLDRGHVGHQAAKMMRRAKAVEKRQSATIEEKSGLLKNIETARELKIRPLTYEAKRLVTLTDIAVSYEGREILSGFYLTAEAGERIALRGKNGSGKSSILKLICGRDIPHTGRADIGSRLIISYVPQDASFLSGGLTAFAAVQNIDETLFKTILSKLDFSRVQFEKNMCDFSAGQKKKVLLAASLSTRAHLYVWDEPLNYIDVLSRMQIEDLIQTYRPSMIFVEHDQAFCDRIATKTVLCQA